jgi:hypothetical protein
MLRLLLAPFFLAAMFVYAWFPEKKNKKEH